MADAVYKAIESFTPDLIVLDIRLSDGDGRKICDEIKIRPATMNVPVILLTALSHAEISKLECAADAIFGKSFNSDNLLLTVADLIK